MSGPHAACCMIPTSLNHPDDTMEVHEYIKLCEEKCEAPVKRNYVKPVTSAEPYWRHISSHQEGTAQEPVISTQSKRQAKKNRQQNQKNNLCQFIGKGLECPHGDGCKYMHDLDAYMMAKAEDLPGTCPFYGSIDSCPYGFMCRFASSHGDGCDEARTKSEPVSNEEGPAETQQKDSQFWKGDNTIPQTQIPLIPANKGKVLHTVNDLEKETQTLLRKRMYDFSTANGVLDFLGIANTAKKKSNRSGNEKRKAPDDGDQAGKLGCLEEGSTKHARDTPKKIFDARGKTYLAPLTTVGNLPFRRVCKSFGADITCGEMAMASNLLQGQASEWALLKRHPEEDFFGVQICGGYPDALTCCAQLIEDQCDVNFVDLNCGCPIDIVVNKGAGSACLKKPKKLESIVRGISSVLTCPVTVKMRRGFNDGEDLAHEIIPLLRDWGASAAVLHGRSREQRYSKLANWDYIKDCAASNQRDNFQVVGNGDVFSWQDHVRALQGEDGSPTGVATTYVARGALIKPWIFTEIKEQRDWDISAPERLDIIGKFVRNGLEHWGSDSKGVENTRRFLLEWLSFSHRYIPVGLLEVLPQRSHWRPTAYVGRSDLETFLGSSDPKDWVMLSEMFLGKAPANFSFKPKHKAKSHATTGKGSNDDPQENG